MSLRCSVKGWYGPDGHPVPSGPGVHTPAGAATRSPVGTPSPSTITAPGALMWLPRRTVVLAVYLTT